MPDEQAVVVPRERLGAIHYALLNALEHLAARDDMNARIHLADARYSPLTELVREAEVNARQLLTGEES